MSPVEGSITISAKELSAIIASEVRKSLVSAFSKPKAKPKAKPSTKKKATTRLTTADKFEVHSRVVLNEFRASDAGKPLFTGLQDVTRGVGSDKASRHFEVIYGSNFGKPDEIYFAARKLETADAVKALASAMKSVADLWKSSEIPAKLRTFAKVLHSTDKSELRLSFYEGKAGPRVNLGTFYKSLNGNFYPAKGIIPLCANPDQASHMAAALQKAANVVGKRG